MKLGQIEIDEKTRTASNVVMFGAPGFGKSTLQEGIVREDLFARQPCMVVDFHGDHPRSLYRKLVRWCAFNAYYDRKIHLIDLSQDKYVVGCNTFRAQEGLDVSEQTSGMTDAVMSVWGDANANSYPVMFKFLKILFTVLIVKGISLVDGFHLLTDKAKMTTAVESLSDPIIASLWRDLVKIPPSEWTRQTSPTINRIFRIVQSNILRQFMCQMSGNLELTFEDTIFINMGGIDHDAAKTFVALLINYLYQSAKRRKGRGGKDPAPYYVYVDEWVLAPTPDFGRILAECRKFGLLLCLANQDLTQVKDAFGGGFAQSLLTLCQIHYCFGGINDVDVSRLIREWKVDPEEVAGLQERECILKLPRQAGKVVTVPNVREPFVSHARVAEYERLIHEQFTAKLGKGSPAKKSQPKLFEDDTTDGYAIQ